MNGKYILDGHEVKQESDLMEWAAWWEKADHHISKTMIRGAGVSTVFLGLDHSFGSGPPLLFETMVFGGPLDGEMDRYTTWEQAEEGHLRMVE